MKVRSLVAAAALAVGALSTHVAHAQPYPSRPREFVVHTSPGGGTDTFARAVADMLGREKIYSQPTTVSNRTGGAGGVAFNYVKSRKGDPHVILGIATGTPLTASQTADYLQKRREEMAGFLQYFPRPPSNRA